MKKMNNLITRSFRFSKEFLLGFTYNRKKQEPIFIVGCGHSGTTLMLRILAYHKDLYGVPFESRIFLGNYIKNSLIKKWNRIIEKEQLKTWVEKTPKHIKSLPKILRTFPKAKVIVMCRDGRDVTVSLRKRTDNSQEAVSRWISHNQKALKFEDDKRFIFIKLEDLTEMPNVVIKDICNHINCEYYDELLNYHTNHFQFQETEPIKTDKRKGNDHLKNRVWQVNQPILKNTSKWREEATPYELQEFDKNSEFIKTMKMLKYL